LLFGLKIGIRQVLVHTLVDKIHPLLNELDKIKIYAMFYTISHQTCSVYELPLTPRLFRIGEEFTFSQFEYHTEYSLNSENN